MHERPHIRALDGLRGVAVAMVLVAHVFAYSGATAPAGRAAALCYKLGIQFGLGVDLFFALSGFLITGILLRAKGREGYFRDFYVRRALRIFPLYYAYLAVTLLLVPALVVVPDWYRAGLSDPWWHWALLTNVKTYLTGSFLSPVVSHAWSLAVEEQFYLFWPLLIFLLPRKAVWRLNLLLIVGTPLYRLYLHRHGVSATSLEVFTLTRLDALAVGGLLASTAAPLRRASWAMICASAGLAVLLLAVAGKDAIRDVFIYRVAVLLFAGVVGLAAAPDGPRALRSVLSGRWLVWLGRYSYGIYLLHNPLFAAMAPAVKALAARYHLGPFGVWGLLAAGPAATAVAAAWCSFHLLEQPFLGLKGRLASRPAAALTPAA
jgi:peptidoglycan/LPS O-acetylase OafA/YrhL